MSNRKVMLVLMSVLLIAVFIVSACSNKPAATPVPASGGTTIDKTAPVEIWIDAAREASAGKFATAFPDKGKLVKLTTTDYGQLPQKILFWNNVGGGWPDGSFSGPQIVPLINDASHSYLGDLAPFVSKDIINGFAPGALGNCWDGAKLYCLRNDLAQEVLYYNAPLLKSFGYTVPTTYEDWAALGAKSVKEHPDVTFIMGEKTQFFFQMLHSTQCPDQQILGPGSIRINAVHDNCKKAAAWVDSGIAGGWLSMTDLFSADSSTTVQNNKWLFMPGPSWLGDYVIVGTYFTKDDLAAGKGKGIIGVAAMPKWTGQDHPYVFWWGGAAWVMSRHTKNPQLVADFLVYMTTDVIKEQGTYPAYMPAATEWLKSMPTKVQYEDPVATGQVWTTEAGHMWAKGTEAPVDTWGIWGPIQSLIDAKDKTAATYTMALDLYQKALLDQAGKLGYQPVTDGLDQ
jgi:ABC-type glycerol-3-phosphate transport system substrate-binding protein